MQLTPCRRKGPEAFFGPSAQDSPKARREQSRTVRIALTRPYKPTVRRPGVPQWAIQNYDPQCAGDAAANRRPHIATNAARML